MTTFWRNRPVFITGATGFLGGWLIGRLNNLGADVVFLIRDMGALTAPDRTAVFGTVTDQSLIERVLGEYQVKTVFHLAAQAQVGVANANPISTFDTNVRGTWSVLEACRRSPLVEQVIVASSDKAYGEQPCLPYTEDMPLLGIQPYDASKACADRLAQTYASQWELPVKITRCGNLFGGGDRTWSRLVPGTIRRLLLGESPVLRGSKAFRDWLYVEDAVDGYLALAEQWPKAGPAFNFSLGIQLSAMDVIGQIANAMGKTIREYSETPSFPGEIKSQLLDSSLARRTLGWMPKHTFAQGLIKTVAWYREHL